MIISEGRNYIFVHIPKTGGTALSTALESRAMKDDILIGDTPKAQKRKGKLKNLTAKGRIWKHSTLDDMAGAIDAKGMFVFTLVRNPWDRMVSYYHWLQVQSFDHAAITRAKSLSFSDFLNAPATQMGLIQNPYKSYVNDNAHYFRIEHLESDLAPMWENLGFQLTIPHVNRSTRPRDWRPFFSSANADLIAKLCAEDIARSDYKFDPA